MSAPTTVLFDEPGPVARRRTRIASIVAAVVLLVVVVLVVIRLGQRQQLTAEKWGPLLDPTNADFTAVWQLLGNGLSVTVRVAAVAVVASVVLGLIIAALRLLLGRVTRIPVIALVELLRGLPVVVTILYVDVLLRTLNVHPGSFWVLAIGLTLYNCVIISEIVRAGIQSLPKGQVEAGLAIGMTRGQVMTQIQLPQAVRAMLPALISQLIVILKDTALGSTVLVSLGDLGEVAQNLRRFLQNPIQTYVVVGAIFVLINLLLGRLASYTERRLATGGKKTSATVDKDLPRLMDAGKA